MSSLQRRPLQQLLARGLKRANTLVTARRQRQVGLHHRYTALQLQVRCVSPHSLFCHTDSSAFFHDGPTDRQTDERQQWHLWLLY